MQDQELKDMFAGFNPPVSDSRAFMRRLAHSLDAVETVRRQNAVVRRLNRRAAVIAASVGFVVGMLFALAIPWVLGAISSIEMPRVEILTLPAADIVRVALWCLTGGVSVVSAINAYDVSLALMRRKQD